MVGEKKCASVGALGRSAVLVALVCLTFTGICGLLTTLTGPATGGGAIGVASHEKVMPVSPLGLVAEYITVDISHLRWLWWPFILYVFWCMAFVCDEYFVRTIDVISERFKIPDDVAGATLMALGCNGPEMALNTIAIFKPSNIGVGAVVGGEVFNVLVIIGTALLATPAMYMPLKLGRFAFFRDVTFYIISVLLLYWTLHDGMISQLNAAVLLCGAVVYVLTVIYTPLISQFFMHVKQYQTQLGLTGVKGGTMRRLSAHLSMALTRKLAELDDDDEDEDEPDIETLEQWDTACNCADPNSGSVLGVRVDMRNRLMDRGHHHDDRYFWLGSDAVYVSTLMDPRKDKHIMKRVATGLAYGHSESDHAHHWHHGGLINQPMFLNNEDALESGGHTHAADMSKPLIVSKETPPAKSVAGFSEAPWEIIPLDDILYCEQPPGSHNFHLHVHGHDDQLGKLITLEFSGRSEATGAWVSALRSRLLEQRRKSTEAPPPPSYTELLMEWVGWLQFPVKFWVARTIPDMDDPKQQHLYPVSFIMSMVWLAIFAFSVITACDGIHADFGISTTVLGFTVAAAGTSFPNVFSGMCVAKQGKTSMAIANALGANVQNVFLALAVPWAIQAFFIEHGSFPMPVDMLTLAVAEIMITLAPVVVIYVCYSFSMPRWAGGFFLVVYLAYVVFAIGQQVSHCWMWPLPCEW